MDKLEIEADKLWRTIIALKFGRRCFTCDKPAANTWPPHSAHHMIKRRFLACRWSVDNGIYLCAKCHEEAEACRYCLDQMLDNCITKADQAKQNKAAMMKAYMQFNMNPPIVHYPEHMMQIIVEDLQKTLDQYN